MMYIHLLLLMCMPHCNHIYILYLLYIVLLYIVHTEQTVYSDESSSSVEAEKKTQLRKSDADYVICIFYGSAVRRQFSVQVCMCVCIVYKYIMSSFMCSMYTDSYIYTLILHIQCLPLLYLMGTLRKYMPTSYTYIHIHLTTILYTQLCSMMDEAVFDFFTTSPHERACHPVYGWYTSALYIHTYIRVYMHTLCILL